MDLKLEDLKLIDNEVMSIFEWVKRFEGEGMGGSDLDKLNVCILIKLKTIINAIEKVNLKDITIDRVPLSVIQARKIKHYSLNESFNKLKNKIPNYSKYLFILSVISFDFKISFNVNIYHILFKFKATIKVAENLLENISIFKLIGFRYDEQGLKKLIQDLFKRKLSTEDFFTNTKISESIMKDDIVDNTMDDDKFDKYYNILNENKDMSYLNLHYILSSKKELDREASDKFITNFCNFMRMDIIRPDPNGYSEDDLLGDVLNKILIESCLIKTILSNLENKYFGSVNDLSVLICSMNISILDKQESILELLRNMLDECEDR